MPGYMQIDKNSPLDVELGFKDNKIWLFQIRPFVENKNALSLNYLEKMAATHQDVKMIKMNTTIQ